MMCRDEIRMGWGQLLAKSLICGVLLGCASLGHADSGVAEEEGTVRLIATLQNNPAFTNVTWTVYRLEGDYKEVETIPRHTVTLTLRPGSYKAVALLNNKKRSRSFQLKSNDKEEIVISMD